MIINNNQSSGSSANVNNIAGLTDIAKNLHYWEATPHAEIYVEPSPEALTSSSTDSQISTISYFSYYYDSYNASSYYHEKSFILYNNHEYLTTTGCSVPYAQSRTLYYSDNCQFDNVLNSYTLVSPTSIQTSDLYDYSGNVARSILTNNKYISWSSDGSTGIYKITDNTTIHCVTYEVDLYDESGEWENTISQDVLGFFPNGDSNTFGLSRLIPSSETETTIGETTEVSSIDINTYPQDGMQNSVYYKYLRCTNDTNKNLLKNMHWWETATDILEWTSGSNTIGESSKNFTSGYYVNYYDDSCHCFVLHANVYEYHPNYNKWAVDRTLYSAAEVSFNKSTGKYDLIDPASVTIPYNNFSLSSLSTWLNNNTANKYLAWQATDNDVVYYSTKSLYTMCSTINPYGSGNTNSYLNVFDGEYWGDHESYGAVTGVFYTTSNVLLTNGYMPPNSNVTSDCITAYYASDAIVVGSTTDHISSEYRDTYPKDEKVGDVEYKYLGSTDELMPNMLGSEEKYYWNKKEPIAYYSEYATKVLTDSKYIINYNNSTYLVASYSNSLKEYTSNLSASDFSGYIYIANSYEFDKNTGFYKLVDPIEYECTEYLNINNSVFYRKFFGFFKNTNTEIFYTDDSNTNLYFYGVDFLSSIFKQTSSSNYYHQVRKSAKNLSYNDSLVSSLDKTAFPESGQIKDILYNYIGNTDDINDYINNKCYSGSFSPTGNDVLSFDKTPVFVIMQGNGVEMLIRPFSTLFSINSTDRIYASTGSYIDIETYGESRNMVSWDKNSVTISGGLGSVGSVYYFALCQ